MMTARGQEVQRFADGWQGGASERAARRRPHAAEAAETLSAGIPTARRMARQYRQLLAGRLKTQPTAWL
jgi:hypothetical protein